MRIPFHLTHVFSPGSSPEDNAMALRVLLDCLVRLNLAYLRNHSAPALYQSGVVYGRTVVWEPIPSLYRRGYGDCKSLSAARIAEYTKQGIQARPVFRFMPKANGTNDFHILVQTTPHLNKYVGADGFEDPSKVLGMGKAENQRFIPADDDW